LRLSRRPLPPADASIDALADADRALLTRIWAGRADAELGAADSFRVVAGALRDFDAEPDLIVLAGRAIEDEQWHARICHHVASLFAGRELRHPVAVDPAVPIQPRASAALRPTLHIVAQCCLNETTASAFLESCLQRATAEPVRTALRALMADDIDHARIGWAHLASPRLPLELRQELGAFLPSLIAANGRAWAGRYPVPPSPVLEAHGCPAFADSAAAVEEALQAIIAPGLARFGYTPFSTGTMAISANTPK
jgi:hypothetical protein